MGEYQWSGSSNSDLGNADNWFPLQGGGIEEPGPNDVAIIEFGPALTGTLIVGALDLIQQGPGEPALAITGPSTQVTATSAGIGNAFTLEAGALLQTGTLSTAAGSSIVVTDAGTQFNSGTMALAGTLTLESGATIQADALSLAGGSTTAVRTGAALDAIVSTGNTMTIGNTAGNTSLIITSGATFNCMSYDTEGDLNLGAATDNHATLTVSGQASLIASPDNFVIGASENSNGLLNVTGAGSSAIFECWGTVYVGPAPGATGTISVTAGGYLLLNSDFGVVDVTSDTMAKIVVAGAGSEVDAGPSVNVGGETVYEEAGMGQILVQTGGTFDAFDLMELDTKATVSVSGAGSTVHTSQMQIFSQALLQASSGGLAQVGICNLEGGKIVLNGGTLSARADYDAQSGSLTGAGTLTAPKIVNGALIDAKGGTLSVIGTITGTGSMHIESGATLQLANSVAASQTLVFESGANTLSLGDPIDFAGKILDFAAGDAIDLLQTTATKVSYAKGALTVFDGSMKVATLHVVGGYSKTGFHVAADGHGGSVISYVAPMTMGVPISNLAWLDHYHV